MIWRPVAAKLDTLTNVETQWSLDDLLDAHEMLDIQAEADQYYAELK